MLSNFENYILRSKEDGPGEHRTIRRLQSTLIIYLDNGTSLLALRQTSQTLRAMVEKEPCRLFRDLYINAPLQRPGSIPALELIATFCQNLTISVKLPPAAMRMADKNINDRPALQGPKRKSMISRFFSTRKAKEEPIAPSHKDPPSTLPSIGSHRNDRKIWISLLTRFHRLTTLKIRTSGQPHWPGRTLVEDTLITLRISLEHVQPPSLRSISLHPIHAMGLIHLRWSGFAAFVLPQHPPSGPTIWHTLHTLDLRIRNPKHLTAAQRLMFLKLLQSYLRSFAATLRCLRFVWLDTEGPSPLALVGFPVGTITWPGLQELWVGNITFPNKTPQLVAERAPNVTKLMYMRSTRRFSRMNPSDQGAWMPMSLGKRTRRSSSVASSVYSQDVGCVRSLDQSDVVSRNSRVVPFMLDDKTYIPPRQGWKT